MINTTFIDELNTIWKLHYDIDGDCIFLELKNEFYFELLSVNNQKRYKLKNYENYVQNIISVQFPHVLISYRHKENLLYDQLISMYNLVTEKEEWMSSEIRIEEVYSKSAKVYHPKISPKKYYYINFHKQEISSPFLYNNKMNVSYADNSEHEITLHEGELNVNINIIDETLVITNDNKKLIEDVFTLNEDYNTEYEYLMKINNYIIFILGKHKMNIYQIKSN